MFSIECGFCITELHSSAVFTSPCPCRCRHHCPRRRWRTAPSRGSGHGGSGAPAVSVEICYLGPVFAVKILLKVTNVAVNHARTVCLCIAQEQQVTYLASWTLWRRPLSTFSEAAPSRNMSPRCRDPCPCWRRAGDQAGPCLCRHMCR